MDIFGTVSAAIGLLEKVKAIFDQVEQNKDDCVVLSIEIVESLLNVQQFWKQNFSCPPAELEDGLSKFESDLRSINASLTHLLKPPKNGALGSSIAKLNEIYNVNDIKNELRSLDRKVQRCHRELQTWSTVRTESRVTATESRVTAMHEDMIARLEELRMLLPGSNPQRRETLERIEEELPEQIRGIDPSGALQLELARAQSRNSLLVAPSIKSSRFSIRSFSPSFVDRRYLKDKVKEISKTLPQACDHVLRQSTFTWFNQFRGLENVSSNMTRTDAIKETIRILEVLQSEKRVPYIETARDLLRLGGALRTLGMQEQGSSMYDLGAQICFKLAVLEGPRTLVDLAKFLHNLSLSLDSEQHQVDAERMFEQAVKARIQLAELKEGGYLGTLASFLTSTVKRLVKENHHYACSRMTKEAVEVLHNLATLDEDGSFADLSQSAYNLAIDLDNAGLIEDAVNIEEGAVMMRRELVEKDRRNHLPNLSLSVHNLAFYLDRTGRSEDAVKVVEEAIEMRRELVEKDRRTHLLKLSSSIHQLALYLDGTGRLEDAVKVVEEAIEMRRELVEKDRRTHLLKLCSSIHQLALYLDGTGRSEDAVKVVEEAIEMRREL
ncbi:hypothetical protein FRC02_003269, partial [Tulasnella sp. 418]